MIRIKLLVISLACILSHTTGAEIKSEEKQYIMLESNNVISNNGISALSQEDKEKYYFSKIDEKRSQYYTDQAKRFYLLEPEPKLNEDELDVIISKLTELTYEINGLILKMHPIVKMEEARHDGASLELVELGMITYRGIVLGDFFKEDDYLDKNDITLVNKLRHPVFALDTGLSMVFTYLKGGNEYVQYQHLMNKYRNDRYLDPTPKPRPGYRFYNLSDFEYEKIDTPKLEKKNLIEKKYEYIYLRIKSAGLIRNTPSAFYPKSFLREYADQTGLTKFIYDAEAKAGKQLKHDELAEQFFGSYDKWMIGFENFLQNKVAALKIEEAP